MKKRYSHGNYRRAAASFALTLYGSAATSVSMDTRAAHATFDVLRVNFVKVAATRRKIAEKNLKLL